MYLADYHTHSAFSMDGQAEIGVLCEAAVEAGLRELCVTDHVEVNGWNGVPYDFPDKAYFEAFEEAKDRFSGKLRLLAGREIGQSTQNTALAASVAAESRLDFRIGSLHNMTGYQDFYFLDYPDVEYCRSLMGLYFEEVGAMIRLGGFEVLGHISYPLRYIRGRAKLDFTFSEYYAEVERIFRQLIESGKGIEINTSGLRQPLGETMPGPDLVKLYRACGGEIVTIGSDAHSAEDIGKGIAEGQEILRRAGFKYFTVFRERKPEFISL